MSKCPQCGFPLGTGDLPGQICTHCRNLSRVRKTIVEMILKAALHDLRRQVAQGDEKITTLKAENQRLQGIMEKYDCLVAAALGQIALDHTDNPAFVGVYRKDRTRLRKAAKENPE